MGRRAATVDPFFAIADGTRRRLLDLLRDDEKSVSDLARNFDISLPAISQHLGVLRQAGLVISRSIGRRRLYRVCPKRLRVVHGWTSRYERFWRSRLDNLREYLSDDQRQPRPHD